MPTFLQSNFNGEWSPLMLGRVELARYATAVRTMENFAPTITGGARKRPGTEFLGEVQDSDRKTRLERFSFSNDQAYLFEFGHNILRFWRDGQLLVDTEVTPYTEDEVFDLRTTGTNDVVYIAHGNHMPQQLIRVSDTDWQLSPMEITPLEEPFSLENGTDITLTPSGQTGTITLTASADFFTADMVGSKFWLGYIKPREDNRTTIQTTIAGVIDFDSNNAVALDAIVREGQNYYKCIQAFPGFVGPNNPIEDYVPDYFLPGINALDSNGNELDYTVEGEWTISTNGTWRGTWQIERSYDDGATWETLFSMQSDLDANFIREGDQTNDPARIRLRLYTTDSDYAAQVNFVQSEVRILGFVEVTAYTSPTEVTANVIAGELLETTATTLWAENEWNPRKGYPSVVFFKNNRLCFARTQAEGQAIWGSEVDNWTNFLRTSTVEETDPFKDVLLTGNQDPIQWASEQSETILGLASQIRNLTREDRTGVLAPGKNTSARQAGRGAAFVDCVEVDDFTFYVQAGGRIVRGLSNDYERGVFAAPDMTREAEHVTVGGVVQMAFQLNRVSTLYAVTGAGECACLVFDPEIEKMGWYRIKTEGGEIESVTVLPTTGEEDEVYFVVKRTINGVQKRYIERLKAEQIRIQDAGIKEEMFFVDCGGTVTGTAMTQIVGLNYLEGETVQVFGDGDYLGDFPVQSGVVTLGENDASDRLTYGLKITASLWPMPLEGVTANGTTSGSKKRVKEITLDLLNSLGLYVQSSPDSEEEPQLLTGRRATDVFGQSQALYSGKAEVRVDLGRAFDNNVYYTSTEPFGVFIRNIITKWEQTSQ